MTYIDPRDPRPVYLYCFGSFGGPFKVGYSNAPRKRFEAIRGFYPGRYYIKGAAIQWLGIEFQNEDDAHAAELLAHADLRRFRVQPRNPHARAKQPEWFDAPLSRIARTFRLCDEAVKQGKHGKTFGKLLPNVAVARLTESEFAAINQYRKSNPGSIRATIRKLIALGLKTQS